VWKISPPSGFDLQSLYRQSYSSRIEKKITRWRNKMWYSNYWPSIPFGNSPAQRAVCPPFWPSLLQDFETRYRISGYVYWIPRLNFVGGGEQT